MTSAVRFGNNFMTDHVQHSTRSKSHTNWQKKGRYFSGGHGHRSRRQRRDYRRKGPCLGASVLCGSD